jgi:hypothetical protein
MATLAKRPKRVEIVVRVDGAPPVEVFVNGKSVFAGGPDEIDTAHAVYLAATRRMEAA